MENDKDVQTVSDLMDNIRDAITDYQVSTIPRWFLHTLYKRTGLDGEPAGHI